MILENEAMATTAVKHALRSIPDPRTKQLMRALAEHMHAFAREVSLTQDELETGLAFLARAGRWTNETRNEMVQVSDVFGLSSLVALLHHPLSEVESAAAVMGPFWRASAPECQPGESISRMPMDGTPMIVYGQVAETDGGPLSGATVDVWQASPDGFYDIQQTHQPDYNFRGKFHTDADGNYSFATLRPAGYPVPTDGPIGELLAAQSRHAYRPAHIHLMVSAEGHELLITQLYVDTEQAMIEDVVFGVTPPLVGEVEVVRESRGDGVPVSLAPPYERVRFDMLLKPGKLTFPTPPIP